MNNFLNYLKNENPAMYKSLSKHKPGSEGFDKAWKSLAKQDANGFNAIQHDFIKKSHYTPAANGLKSTIGFDVSTYPPAVQDVLWSTSVQHGIGGAIKVFRSAGIKQGMSPEEIIRRVYAERRANNGAKYFSKSSAEIRQSVVKRFEREEQDALRMLG